MTPSPSRWPEAALTLARTFGARGFRLRLEHELRRRVGRFREAPRHVARPGDPAHWLRPDAGALADAVHRDPALERADRVLRGEYQAYRHEWRPLPEGPEAWVTHPATRHRFAPGGPWWHVGHLAAAGSDIKDVWEPARFAWLYDLVRAYALTGDRRYADGAARRIADWDASCPAFEGVHWSCGQEAAIRAVALLHAEAVLAEAWDDEARGRVVRLLGASGERIADAIGYAVSQRNNHALSEAAGLVLLGVRLGEGHPEAPRWLRVGRRWVETLIREQFAPDGWYIQHSFVYARLALEQCVLAERALRAAGQRLSDGAAERVRAGAELLLHLVDAATGDVPNHGPNDGAFVWPTTLAPFRDFRPVVTAVAALWEMPVPSEVPIDAERLAWMRLAPPPRAPRRGGGVHAGPSGWAVARVGEAVAFLRAGRYTSRPGHIDPLHVDVRIGSQSVVVDPGTYSYNAPAPWNNGLVGAGVHNGPLLDGQEPGVRGPRFLWYLWPSATITGARIEEGEAVLQGEREGAVRRTVRVRSGQVVVEDRVLDLQAQTVSLTWTLPPGVDESAVEVEAGRSRPALDGGVAGWVSPHYGQRIPGRFVAVQAPADPDTPIVTVIHPPVQSAPS